jgi:hypothetical protein
MRRLEGIIGGAAWWAKREVRSVELDMPYEWISSVGG